MGAKQIGKTLPKVLFFSLLAGIAVTVLIAAITATLVSSEKLSDNGADILSMAAILLGAATTAWMTAGKMDGIWPVMCLMGGIAYLMLLMCCGALLFDGVKSGIGPTALVTIAGSGVVALLGLKGKRPKYKIPKLKL